MLPRQETRKRVKSNLLAQLFGCPATVVAALSPHSASRANNALGFVYPPLRPCYLSLGILFPLTEVLLPLRLVGSGLRLDTDPTFTL